MGVISVRTLRAVGGAVLASALIFVSAPNASADQVREAQWALGFFDAEDVWKISQGEGVTVAVIDDGVKVNHPDIEKNLLTGKDFIDSGDVNPADGENHGTAMASIIAGHGHGVGSVDGVKGLAPKAKILPIRNELTAELDEPIRYAVDQGAKVINISLGSSAPDRKEAEAVAYALEHDVLIVTASGNEGESFIGYPGGYPGTLTVGAVGEEGKIWKNSNYAPEVLLTAPGVDVVTAGNSSPYRKGSGTSDSSAFVSAAAALLRAEYPDLTAGQVVNRLVKTAGLPDSARGLSLPDEKYGYGYIRPLAALTEDIPAGPKYGPLSVPESLQSQAPVESDSSSGDSSNTVKRVLVFVVAPLVLLLMIVAVVVIVVSARRRRNRAQRDAGWSGGPGQQSYGQVPPNATGGFPPHPQGPHQNQHSNPWGQ